MEVFPPCGGGIDVTRNAFGLSSHSEVLREGEFWAVDEVSFNLQKGETLGIIGPNGSGKSTILKMLNGIFLPDKGRIEIKGKVGALIEIGAGFHPMLTGRENIYINGAILGLSKREIDKRFDDIVDFANIGNFIDAPVKHYSAGMYVRLGFAVAVHSDPDILLVDEVLSVGDVNFRKKCAEKINEIKNRTSIVFVSHSINQIYRLCNRVILLVKGEIKMEGSPETVVTEYINMNLSLDKVSDDILVLNSIDLVNIENISLYNMNGKKTRELDYRAQKNNIYR